MRTGVGRADVERGACWVLEKNGGRGRLKEGNTEGEMWDVGRGMVLKRHLLSLVLFLLLANDVTLALSYEYDIFQLICESQSNC